LCLKSVAPPCSDSFERSDPDLNYLTRLDYHVCAVVQDSIQFDSKLAVLSDSLHQGVDEIAQGSDVLWREINVALVLQIHLHGCPTAGSCSTTENSATEVLTDLLQNNVFLLPLRTPSLTSNLFETISMLTINLVVRRAIEPFHYQRDQ
jgi:hypothetical protein